MKTFRSVILTLCFVSLIVISGCRHQRTHSATEKHYDLKGKVVLVEKDQHLVGDKPVEFLMIDEEDFERSQRAAKEAPPML